MGYTNLFVYLCTKDFVYIMKPTETELSILGILWKLGPSTVRQVNAELSRNKPVGYTNTLKMMQIMHEKGMLERDESSRSHIYSPSQDPDEVRNSAIDHMVNTLFGGSRSSMMLQALGNTSVSSEEIEEIRKILVNMEKESDHDD